MEALKDAVHRLVYFTRDHIRDTVKYSHGKTVLSVVQLHVSVRYRLDYQHRDTWPYLGTPLRLMNGHSGTVLKRLRL